jgi:hypothetical protein
MSVSRGFVGFTPEGRTVMLILAIWVSGLAITLFIGAMKRRTAEGFVLGLLGPFGIPMVLVLKRKPEA